MKTKEEIIVLVGEIVIEEINSRFINLVENKTVDMPFGGPIVCKISDVCNELLNNFGGSVQEKLRNRLK